MSRKHWRIQLMFSLSWREKSNMYRLQTSSFRGVIKDLHLCSDATSINCVRRLSAFYQMNVNGLNVAVRLWPFLHEKVKERSAW